MSKGFCSLPHPSAIAHLLMLHVLWRMESASHRLYIPALKRRGFPAILITTLSSPSPHTPHTPHTPLSHLMYICPKNHNSTEADFCSECGAKIMGLGIAELVSNPTNPTPTPVSIIPIASEYCPDCSTPHEAATGSFCEICGYNFLTSAKGGNPLSNFPPPINLSASIDLTPTTATNPVGQWQLVISIDPTLATPDSPTAPTQTPITIDLNQGTNLIGRTSQARAIHPEIPLDFDDAVSSRHAILTLHPDGSLVLRDIGSSNGTMVNGKEIAIMADISIGSGDEITLGHWTRIKLSKK